ncbi:MAG: ATP-binding protein [Candidatus Aenigmarchaeota archaeon]|nr:ATP-binding protein [Candidatus Aenigmarchaeota archaeon]
MDIHEVLRRLRPILGDEQVNRSYVALQLADPRTARIIELTLRQQLAEATGSFLEARSILLEPIPEDRAAGDFPLGRVFYGNSRLHRFGLRAGELIQHCAIFGRSGAGKTNVAYLLLRQLALHELPFLVFDWKATYRDLLPMQHFGDLVVYTVGRDSAPFTFNPLVPPADVDPQEWIKKLIQILQHVYYLGEGVAYLLQEALDQLYRDFGVYQGSGRWPTFRDLRRSLEAWPVKGRHAAWMESAIRAVGVLTFGAIDRVVNAGPGLPVAELLQQRAVLELDALDQNDKTFFIESLLLWIHHHRMREPDRERLKHVLLIEEAHHVLLRKKQELTGAEAVTDVILREVREFGQAIVLVDQLPSLISKPALENTFTTISMNLKEKGDVTAAAKAMLLEPDEARYLGHLPVGGAIAKLQGRWTRPFLVGFPLLRVRKGSVTDAQVQARWLERSSSATGTAPQPSPQADHPPGSPSPARPEQARAEWTLLEDVRDYPLSGLTERYARLGLGDKAGRRVVAALLQGKLIETADVPIGRSFRRLLGLTASSRRLLGLREESGRAGSLEHRFWAETLATALLATGALVEKETPLGNGAAVDILVTKDGQRTAIEVETGKADWEGNVRKCLAVGMERVVVAVTRTIACKDILAQVAASGLPPTVRVLEADALLKAVLAQRDA